MSSGAGGPATCPLAPAAPPANQKTCSPSPAPASYRRDPPSQSSHLHPHLHLVPDPRMMAVQAEATATGGARFFPFAPLHSSLDPHGGSIVMQLVGAAGCRCTSAFTSAVRRYGVCGVLMRSRLNQGGGHGSAPSQPPLTSDGGRSGTCHSLLSVSPPPIGVTSGEGWERRVPININVWPQQ